MGWCGTGRQNLTIDTKFSGASGDMANSVFPVQLTTSRIIGNHTGLMPSLLKVMITHTTKVKSSEKLNRTKGENRPKIRNQNVFLPYYTKT